MSVYYTIFQPGQRSTCVFNNLWYNIQSNFGLFLRKELPMIIPPEIESDISQELEPCATIVRAIFAFLRGKTSGVDGFEGLEKLVGPEAVSSVLTIFKKHGKIPLI